MSVGRKASLFSCALSAEFVDDGMDDGGDVARDVAGVGADGEDAPTARAARRVARDLRGKLLDAVVRGHKPRIEDGKAPQEAKTSRLGKDSECSKRERAMETRRALRVGGLLGEAVPRAGGDENGDYKERAIARMSAVCKLVLSLCAEILQPAHADIERAASMSPPPLGTHVIRRESMVDDQNLGRSVYFQEQSSFKFETSRTADHFIDGERQRIYASVKVQTTPRVSSSGAVVTVHLDKPPPMVMHESMKSSVREGCFVELYGASGHPDYLRRVKNRDGDTKGEIYEFNLPSLRVSGLARGYPTGELEGEVVVSCQSTGLIANIKFRPFDVETSPAFRNIVSGTMAFKNADVQRLILGTWDTRILCGRIPHERLKTDDLNETLLDAHQFEIAPLTTATGVRSLSHALRSPARMRNKRLWQTIVEAMRVADLSEPERSVVNEIINKVPSAVKEKVGENIRMGYEMAAIVADDPATDEPPPLPRYWFPISKTDNSEDDGASVSVNLSTA